MRVRAGSVLSVAAITAAAALLPSTARSQVLHEIVPEGTATGGSTIGTFAYDPTRDIAYVTSFGAGGSLRKVTNVSSGTQTSSVLVSESQMQLFYRDGNPDRSVGTPIQSGFLLNPQPIGANAAYSFGLIIDAASTRYPFPPGVTAQQPVDPSATKRVYSFNLQSVPAGGDGRDVFTTRATLGQLNAAAGASVDNTSSNTGRQFVWSGDGQSIYFADSSNPTTAVGGIWKLNASSGVPQRLMADEDLLTEPAVVRSGNTDKIYVRGGGTTGNVNGIDFITHDGATTSARQVAVTAATLRNFLELPVNAAIAIASISADADGNLYFLNSTGASVSTGVPDRRGLYKLDTQGRLSKVVNMAERVAVLGSTNSFMNRQQLRTVNHTGPGGTFPISQILYAESGLNSIAAVDIFKTGDFNRDNLVNDADAALFRQQVTPRGVTSVDVAKFVYDVNGNNGTDWKDVKVLQPFFDFGDGDINLNGLTDFADFLILRDNYNTSNKAWTLGDLTGDNAVTFADFEVLRDNMGGRSKVIGLGLTPAPFDQLEWDRFVASVPEPGSVAALGLVGVGLLARRRRAASALA